MRQELLVDEEMRTLLLALGCRDLRRVMSGVLGTLEVFSQETGNSHVQTLETMKIADHIAYMQFAAGNLLDNLDELLNTLRHVCPEVENIVGDAGRLEVDGVEYGPESCAALREKRLRELSAVPPHILHM